ncbi:MAG TPA: class I SAM-dependent methyltransferase, partial [Anaerolineales bacterium]|nr:class I SAM-dependent methyltransferase [Anaerolineales bacterium]
MNVITVEMTPEMETLKTRLKATWMSGDYGHFAKYLEPGALEFLSHITMEPGMRILDVACGAGQTAIPMSRAGAKVTGIDIATNLIEQARARAHAENLDARFDEGDAEMLPYDDSSFDIVISLIGAMFAPRPELVTAELKRVCRPGGKIIMGNWTPTGFVGQMFKTMGKHVPPPAIMAPPVKWGDEEVVRERYNDGISYLKLNRRLYPFRYPFPPSDVVEFFRTYYGPTHKAFAALDTEKQSALRQDLEQLWINHNTATDGTTSLESEYLEVVAIRQ